MKESSLLFMIEGYVGNLDPVSVVNLKNMPGYVYILKKALIRIYLNSDLEGRTFKAICQGIIFYKCRDAFSVKMNSPS